MTNLADALTRLGDALADVVVAAFDEGGLDAMGDVDVLAALASAARVRRSADALMIEAVAQLLDRDDAVPHADRITTRYGCRNAGELIERATRVSGRAASEMITAAKAVRQPTSISTGESLPADFPRLREALAASRLGVDGVTAVAGAFRGCSAGRVELLAADEELAAAACGTGVDAAAPATADELRSLAQVWATYLDQDGTEPTESRAMRKRGLTIGRRNEDGVVPLRGYLLPEVAAQLELCADSVLNPRVDGAPAPGPNFSDGGEADPAVDADEPIEAMADARTSVQKRHDALATILAVAAASGTLPALGGAAPTLVVSVRAEDLASGRGPAHVPGHDEPISAAAARQIACSGAVERVVMGENGRIVSIDTLDRLFNHHQRKAITLRDGCCVIPGCHVSARWCEIHHVEEHSRGGPTHTDNGVLLCWFHHRTIDTGGWQIRMIDGVPHVRGPYWWDAEVRWRPATKSPTRRREQIALRI